MKPKKRSKTLRIESYVKIEVPGQPSYMEKVVKKVKLREMSERKFGKWSRAQSRNQSGKIMGIVDELGDDEADSWHELSIKIHVSSD